MKIIKNKIWLSSPHMGGSELKYVNEAFETNWVAPIGPNVNGFEEDLQNFTGSKYAAALTSGTAAIHLGLIILGVKPGDTVICQSLTFSASANPIAYIGAIPVFVDSEEETWNMSPLFLRKAIEAGIANGKKPKAIIPVHLYGMPANMPEIVSIANEFQIPIIEDAAEGLGSRINGKFLGTFGEIGVLSFNGNKIITTSGGGSLISDNKEYIDEARFLATQARDNAPHYQHSKIGFNYRMSNISAGIGRGQIEVLNDRINKRRENFEFYKNALKDIKEIQFLEEPQGYFSNRWLTTILVNPTHSNITRETIRLALEQDNIESRPLWKPMHMQPVFSKCAFFGDGTSEKLFDTGLCLPSGSNLSDEDLWRVSAIILRMFNC